MTSLSRLNRVLLPLPQILSASYRQQLQLISTTAVLDKWGDKFVPKKTKVDECPPDYKEYPERDLINYPRPKKYMFSPKVRLGFIPDSWFNFLYNKTGVTGPYVLGAGLLAFMLNKELYIITPENKYVVSFIAVVCIITNSFGAQISEIFYNFNNYHDKLAENMKMKQDQVKECIDESKDIVDRCRAWSDVLFQAQRDQVYLILEEEYRKRLAEYKTAVKRKLDYLVDIDDAKKRIQRRHIVDWVVDQVKSSIDESVQNAAFNQCVVHLKTLSSKAQI